MQILKIFIISFLTFYIGNLNASEGMWLPILLEKYTIEEMQQQGFKLSVEDIYDINNASLKDAVVGLVRLNNPFHHFCSGEVISNQGLLLTNHHCGYSQIQSHSSLENDYLTNGFWAMSKEEELTNEGIGVCFLKRMEDVTSKVLANINDAMQDVYYDSIIEANIKAIEQDAVEGTHYLAKVKPFFAGNEYYLSVYEVFRDIRLVGAPPSAIGKFGGDTDNWMWPRHTGDFSMFRIYADSNNNPADISEANVPYKPLKHLNISLNGVEKGDFTMVMGYPGTTQENLPAAAVKRLTETINPIRIKVRTKGLDIMKADMNTDPEIRIKYSAKVAGMSNGWKKWIGENRGLKKLDAIDKKLALEKEFMQWVNNDNNRKEEYGTILEQYENLYHSITPYQKAATYFYETIYSLELNDLASSFYTLTEFDKTSNSEAIEKRIKALKNTVEKHFKNYNLTTDKKLFTAFIEFYYNDISNPFHPEIFELINSKFKGNIEKFVDYIFSKSMFPDHDKINAFLNRYSISKNKSLLKDPIIILYSQAINNYRTNTYPALASFKDEVANLHKKYTKGLREFQKDKTHFPDANSTFRIAYGQIDDYKPRDAVAYFHFTTLEGIIEKDNPDIYDYDVPDKLKELYNASNFGKYSNTDGIMPVCFTASNHTTGGNSGSPILNAYGQLIGINFDRNWEGTMSDIMYDPNMCRNISLDIRYVLFIVDKFAGAKHLVDEMNLIQTTKHK
ncbi:MAG: S46 family peptidase [Salinivirgaceae bacterium]|jgi:hypothetical protein|nr:S46 family peptidase [Salinivirgaceae bacterium]